MRYVWLWLFCASVTSVSRGAFEAIGAAPRAAALGGLLAGAGVPGREGLFDGSRFSFSFSPGLFNLPELSTAAAGYARWYGTSFLSLAVSRFGGGLYREWEGSVAAEFAVDSAARLGGRCALMHLGIEGYGSVLIGGISLSGGAVLEEGIAIRFALLNLLAGRVGEDPLPRIMALALEWRAADRMQLFVEARCETDQQSAWSIGAEWEPVAGSLIRAGTSTDHPGFDCGAAFVIGGVRFEYGFRWHRDLGGTHLIGIAFDDLF